MEYSIGEFSRLVNLGIHTLRYYEQEGLLSPGRNAVNRRRYSERDISWAAFIKRLKETGMPVKGIRHYAELRAGGEATLQLAAHREALSGQIKQLEEHMAKLDDKIAFYRQEIERASQNHSG